MASSRDPHRTGHEARRADVPAAADFAPTASRPLSLWPDSTRPGGRSSSAFATTRFDPLADDRARAQAQAAAAFDVCRPALALRCVLLVQAVLAVVALAGADGLAAWGARQAALAGAGLAGTGLWLAVLCLLRPALIRIGNGPRAAAVLGLGASMAMAAWAALVWLRLAEGMPPWRWAGAGLTGAALAALLWAWLDLRSRIWHPTSADPRPAEAPARIRPQVLFDALSTALALVRSDPPRAEAVLGNVTELLRASLADPQASVALDEELEFVRRYLAIEQVRHGARLEVQWLIDPRAGEARVPPLLLQPLVEDAVRHGVELLPHGGWVRIEATWQRAQVTVLVSHRVGDEPEAPGPGAALQAMRERLRLLHDVAARCEVWREPAAGAGVAHARIVLPAPAVARD